MKESLPPSADQPRKRPSPAKKKNQKLLVLSLLLGAIAVLLVIVIALLPRVNRPPVRLPQLNYESDTGHDTTAPQSQRPESRLRNPPATSSEPASPASQPAAKPAQPVLPTAYRKPAVRGKLIFVIDDVGNNVDELRPFLSVPGPLTLSIMPQRPFTLESYHLILNAGKVPILHQPMQADGNQNPGAGAIYTSMTKQQVDATLQKNLEGMDAIRWVNNHEGSKATSNIDTMTYVLSYLKGRGIHFLDSRTSRATQVKNAALRLGLPYYKRNSYFLDNIVNKADILKEIDSGLQVAQKEGYAVMIGHVWDKDLARILTNLYPKLKAQGYEITDIRSLLMEPSTNAGTGN